MVIDLSISIVHHNKNRKLLEECLDSIFKETKNIKFEAFVIDNCSDDKVPELIEEKFPKIKLIQNKQKEGFAKNHNKALKLATGRYLLILNDDTLILDSALEKMVKFMDKNPTLGALGCKTYPTKAMDLLPSCPSKHPFTPLREFFDSFVTYSRLTRMFKNTTLVYTLGCGTMGPIGVDFVTEVAHVGGACMMVRKEAAEQVGLMDENFIMFLEETDWCYRIKQKGWKIYYYPKAYIIHYGGQSLEFFNKNRHLLHEKSLAYFFKKHYGRKGILSFRLLRALLSPLILMHMLYLRYTYSKFSTREKILDLRL